MKVAIVGAGLMGRWHCDAARRAGAEVVAVVDTDLDRARALAGAESTAHLSLESALGATPDAIHICTPLDSHAVLAQSAISAGCHVILEKPALPTRPATDALLQQATAAGRLVVPVHQFVFQDGVREIIERRASIGPIRQLEFATCSAGADGKSKAARDQVAAEIVPHAFSLARAILGTNVSELSWRLDRSTAGEWRFSAVTSSGMISGMISMRARPTFATCRVLGDGGSAHADLFQGFAVFEPATSSTRYKVVRPIALSLGTAAASAAQLAQRALQGEKAYPGLRALCAASYRAFTGAGPAPFPADELVDVASARDQLLAQLPGH